MKPIFKFQFRDWIGETRDLEPKLIFVLGTEFLKLLIEGKPR